MNPTRVADLSKASHGFHSSRLMPQVWRIQLSERCQPYRQSHALELRQRRRNAHTFQRLVLRTAATPPAIPMSTLACKLTQSAQAVMATSPPRTPFNRVQRASPPGPGLKQAVTPPKHAARMVLVIISGVSAPSAAEPPLKPIQPKVKIMTPTATRAVQRRVRCWLGHRR